MDIAPRSVHDITIPDGPCVEQVPRSNSVRLGTRYINLARLADESGISSSYLSRAIREPDRMGSVKMLKKMAIAIGVSLDDLIILLEERKKSGNRPNFEF